MLSSQAVAVENFSSWLKDEVVKREGDETGKAKVVLCSHRCAFASMVTNPC